MKKRVTYILYKKIDLEDDFELLKVAEFTNSEEADKACQLLNRQADEGTTYFSLLEDKSDLLSVGL